MHADARPGTSRGAARTVPAAVLREQLACLGRHHPRVGLRVETVAEQPARAVLGHSADAHLVVVGDRRLGVVHRVLTASLSHAVLHGAACSVAVVS